ncbi:MAG: hydrogenase formation protein HypD [bacterium]|nr:MAG: hydrogenase formation protein HypD [bacterium]
MTDDLFDSFHDPAIGRRLAEELRRIRLKQSLRLMHVCGTHEHAIAKAGIRSFLPDGLRLIAGPGCPVCVCPAGDIEMAIQATERDDVIVATFGDMFRVPSSRTSLEEMKASGADVRIVYSPMDAVRIAEENTDREVVFMAVGFETTAAPIAATLLSGPPRNFSIVASIRLIPPALKFLLDRGGGSVDGFVLPGHVSVIIGKAGYQFLESQYGVPCVIAGFESVDVMQAVIELIHEAEGDPPYRVANLYRRVVSETGNKLAQEAIDKVFTVSDSQWRGIGSIPSSGLVLRPEYYHLDAAMKLGLKARGHDADLLPGCICNQVILGDSEPEECPLFGTGCTPYRPHGPCMVSSEGTCRARYLYRPVT